MNQPFNDLATLYLFPRYQTRNSYRAATGKEPPEFNDALPPKYWEDPEAIKSPRRNVLYDRVVAATELGKPMPGPDGNPTLEVLTLQKSEAAAVNIPPDGTNVPGADAYEVPVPLRELQPYEKLVFGIGSHVTVRDTRVALPTAAGDFTEQDRAVLNAIARKLGAY